MNPDPDAHSNPADASRDKVIALLTLLPRFLGSDWPADDTGLLDPAACRMPKELTIALRIGVREFTFVHSLDPERRAWLVVECRYGLAPRFSAVECYHELLARSHQDFPVHACTYALDPSTKAVVHLASYLLESLNVGKLADVVVDAARQAASWQEEFAPASDASPGAPGIAHLL